MKNPFEAAIAVANDQLAQATARERELQAEIQPLVATMRQLEAQLSAARINATNKQMQIKSADDAKLRCLAALAAWQKVNDHFESLVDAELEG
jgi:uncharacterized protein (DUF3084 family)